MKTLIALAVFLGMATAAFADWTEQRVGNTDFYSGDNGYSGTGQQVGNTYFYNDNRGGSVTCQQVGNTTFCN